MSRLASLYQEMILSHNRSPQNFGDLDPHTHHSHGVNPVCGDDFHLYLFVEDNRVSKVSFKGQGCAISKASASILTETVLGKSIQEIIPIKDAFLKLISDTASTEEKAQLGKLKIFEGVKEFPVRVKCAALIWRALEDAISQQHGQISTE